jgi:hypothetical protein
MEIVFEELPSAKHWSRDTIFTSLASLMVLVSLYLCVNYCKGLKRDTTDTKNAEVTLIRMCYAAGNGDLEQVKHIIEEKGVDVNMADYDGRTALHLAASEGQVEVVNYLIG